MFMILSVTFRLADTYKVIGKMGFLIRGYGLWKNWEAEYITDNEVEGCSQKRPKHKHISGEKKRSHRERGNKSRNVEKRSSTGTWEGVCWQSCKMVNESKTGHTIGVDSISARLAICHVKNILWDACWIVEWIGVSPFKHENTIKIALFFHTY